MKTKKSYNNYLFLYVLIIFSGPATENTFAIDLSTTNSSNRTVDCRTNQTGQFSCEFCIEINKQFTCYDLENSTSQSAANLALTNNLGEGTYFYRATASLNGVRMQPMINFFRTGRHYFSLCSSYLMYLLFSSCILQHSPLNSNSLEKFFRIPQLQLMYSNARNSFKIIFFNSLSI